MNRNDGGPAFPAHEYKPHGGMTLRDYASIQFHAAMISGALAAGNGLMNPDDAAHLAQGHADAYLARRDA